MTATVGPPPLADEPRRPERRLNGHAADAGGPVADGGNPDVTARELQALRREMARLRSDYAQLRGLLSEMREGGADPAAPPPTAAVAARDAGPGAGHAPRRQPARDSRFGGSSRAGRAGGGALSGGSLSLACC